MIGKRWSAMAAMILSIAAATTQTEAVAFKMKNDSRHTLRARAYDRGKWRNPVVFRPGGWGDFAPGVTRGEHSIMVEIQVGRTWKRIYMNHHGSRVFTRVVQAVNGPNGKIAFAWWDEPPTCRSAPPNPMRGGKTCLKESGWIFREMFKYARMAGEAYVVGG